MKHVCVIGGTGFIGSAVVRALRDTHAKVTAIGTRRKSALVDGVEYLYGNFGNTHFLNDALKDAQQVVHLAHTSVPKTSFDDPVDDLNGNLPPSVRLFETACDRGIEKLIFVSSGGTVYGPAERLPIREDAATSPISPYGITKLATEKYAQMFFTTRQLPVVCVRPSNAFGAGQVAFSGQGLIATAMSCFVNRRILTLFGNAIRDYIHVRDVAAAICATLKKGIPGEVYNIGSGVGRKSSDVIAAITELARHDGRETIVKHIAARSFDVPSNILACDKIRRDTGWTPTVAFEDGLRETWDYFMAQK
jgi:UDP-glucose 4-epimerase